MFSTPLDVTIYTSVPPEHWDDIVENGLKSLAVLDPQKKWDVKLPGSEKLIYFRPYAGGVSNPTVAYIGIDVPPLTTFVHHQEYRIGFPSEYKNSILTLSDYLEKYNSKERSSWVVDLRSGLPQYISNGILYPRHGGQNRMYATYIPEVVVEQGIIPPSEFTFKFLRVDGETKVKWSR
ncbi:MAG: hypothetical protein ACTSUE_03670 [Promethearchaeota archaeon]